MNCSRPVRADKNLLLSRCKPDRREILSYGDRDKGYSELVLHSGSLEPWRIRLSLFDLRDSYGSVSRSSSHNQIPTAILSGPCWCLGCSDRSCYLHRFSRDSRYFHMVDYLLLYCSGWFLTWSRVQNGVKKDGAYDRSGLEQA